MSHTKVTLIIWTAMLCVVPLSLASSETDFHAAVKAGDAKRVEALLARTPALLYLRDKAQQFPLHTAVLARQAAVVDVLVKHGADVNATDPKLNTPLHIAVRGLDTTIVTRLLESKAKVDVRNKRGQTVLHVAALAGRIGKDVPVARRAITALLLEYGVGVNATNRENMTPLHLASVMRRAEMVGQLIEAGADVRAQDAKGRTAMHWAALNNQVAIIEQLVHAGADVNATDNLGETPLHCAARRFRAEATKLLIAKRATVDARSKNGSTPLILLAKPVGSDRNIDEALAAVAELLLNAGADANARDAEGATAIHHVLHHHDDGEYAKFAETLRRHGATE